MCSDSTPPPPIPVFVSLSLLSLSTPVPALVWESQPSVSAGRFSVPCYTLPQIYICNLLQVFLIFLLFSACRCLLVCGQPTEE